MSDDNRISISGGSIGGKNVAIGSGAHAGDTGDQVIPVELVASITELLTEMSARARVLPDGDSASAEASALLKETAKGELGRRGLGARLKSFAEGAGSIASLGELAIKALALAKTLTG